MEAWTVQQTPLFTGATNAFTQQLLQREREAVYCEVADSGPADTVYTFRHGLGRVPRGLRIVNCAVTPGDEYPVFKREADDPAWTAIEVSVRFSCTNGRLLLEVF